MRRSGDKDRSLASPQTPARAAIADPWAVQGDDGPTQVVLAFDDNRLATLLFGHYGRNLALIERKLGVKADSRGNHVTLEGGRDACEQARRVLEQLYDTLRRGREIGAGDVEGAIREAVAQGSLFDFDPAEKQQNFDEIQLRRRPVRHAPLRRMPISVP